MTEYRKRHGTAYDAEDVALESAKGWRDLALSAQIERDQLHAAMTEQQQHTAALEAKLADEQHQRQLWKNAFDEIFEEHAAMRKALSDLLPEYKEFMDNTEDDHSVGICNCSTVECYEVAVKLLAE
jgi:chromosome segregation ATPase